MILSQRIEESHDSKEILHLRGQLIELLKKTIKETSDGNLKMQLDVALYDEMKKHKDHIEKMRKEAKVKKYPISEKLSLKVKDISASMEVFKKRLDMPGRLKQGVVSGAVSGIFSIAVSAGIGLIGGNPLMSAISLAVPTACYVGLSSVISSLFSGSQKSQIYKKLDDAPEEARKELDFCQRCISNNEPFIRLLMAEGKLKDTKERIRNEEQLIKEYKKIIEQAPSDQIRQVITLEMVDVMKTLQHNYAYLENEVKNNREQLSEEDYQKVINRKEALKIEIDSQNSFYKDSIKTVAKNVVKQTAISYAARIALAGLFPGTAVGKALSFKDKSTFDKLSPLLYTALGNVFSIGGVAKSIQSQKTDYTGTILQMTRPELFEKQRAEAAARPALYAA
jgi:hypothetical protein